MLERLGRVRMIDALIGLALALLIELAFQIDTSMFVGAGLYTSPCYMIMIIETTGCFRNPIRR